MGILDAAFDSFEGLLANQWKDVVTSAPFNEHTLVAPGVRKRDQEGYGANRGLDDILSNGSIIFVPENTAAFIFSQSGIEQIITTPGGYEYRNGEATVFDKQDRQELGLGKILLSQAGDRLGFSGMSSEEKRVAFVNLREIRNIKFGTRGPLVYNDQFYGCDLEVYAYGSFSVKVTDPALLVRNFVPAGVIDYSFDNPKVRSQMLAEFLHSFIVAASGLSTNYRASMLPAHADEIRNHITHDTLNAGTWESRFGITLIAVAIENIELSEQSRQLVQQFSERRMGVKAYEDISQAAANVVAQQMIAQGVRDNGFGDMGGMLFGMNLANGINPFNASSPMQGSAMAVVGASGAGDGVPTAQHAAGAASGTPSPTVHINDQVETLRTLKGLVDAGILTQEEFEAKKRQVLGL